MNVVARHNLFDDWLPINIFGAATFSVNELAQERVLIHADGRSTEDIDWKPIIEKIVASHNIHMSCPRESLQGTVTA